MMPSHWKGLRAGASESVISPTMGTGCAGVLVTTTGEAPAPAKAAVEANTLSIRATSPKTIGENSLGHYIFSDFLFSGFLPSPVRAQERSKFDHGSGSFL